MRYISGKKELFSLLKTLLPESSVIVEAGAFDGKDALFLASAWPQGIVHCFEPVPEVYERLVLNTRDKANIKTYPYALSDKNGRAELYIAEKKEKPGVVSQASSLLKPKERLFRSSIEYPRTQDVKTITLDAWAQQQKIEHIDFLWLDLQGMALPVLQASPDILKTVKALWIEVEFIEAYESQATYEMVIDFLKSQGFGIMARDFQTTQEWFFGNVLAVRELNWLGQKHSLRDHSS